MLKMLSLTWRMASRISKMILKSRTKLLLRLCLSLRRPRKTIL